MPLIDIEDRLEDYDEEERAEMEIPADDVRQAANAKVVELVKQAQELLKEAETLAEENYLEFDLTTDNIPGATFKGQFGPYGETGYEVDWDASTC